MPIIIRIRLARAKFRRFRFFPPKAQKIYTIIPIMGIAANIKTPIQPSVLRMPL